MPFHLRLVEHLYREIEREGRHDFRRRVRGEIDDRFGNVRRAQSGKCLGEIGGIAVKQIKELGRSWSLKL